MDYLFSGLVLDGQPHFERLSRVQESSSQADVCHQISHQSQADRTDQ